MGVPKFYRWISERYPCLSEIVKEYQIPEFDNLYLDMNGIIHTCSHPEDDNPHFRITEEKIFELICHYIEVLFRTIKPKKVFFMAVDGVAPRAKMNQQRGRRFRSAREAEDLVKKAIEKGESLPKEERFDSNCITPGTEFMVRLHEHLQYFVANKVNTDRLWQGVRIYLSGHETPGEGEHKIMDFIRHEKAQKDYNPNTRHCLYGLDADLIMLGLTSHEPHFSLLREEVKFGKNNQKRSTAVEETTFHLLHLSLMREYLGHEFEKLEKKVPFEYSIEKVIDDWVLMGFLVGNDFIPHLPHMHIHQDCLPLLWETYKKILPKLGGYINEGGFLNLERFEMYLAAVSKIDSESFEEQYADIKWAEGKMRQLEKFEDTEQDGGSGATSKKTEPAVSHSLSSDVVGIPSAEEFMKLRVTDGTEENGGNDDGYIEEEDEEEESEEESDSSPDEDDPFQSEFLKYKANYYIEKMDFKKVTSAVLESQAFGYVKAIQWILHYYYNGCQSWSWYYPHHYAPYLSDIKNFKNLKIEYEMGQPFLPFQQLMAVLPTASKALLPKPLQSLMVNDTSPVIDYYPVDFLTDLNGKQQEWEAVVLIPFIDENRLLDAMKPELSSLSESEKARNSHGPHLLYTYSTESLGTLECGPPNKYKPIVNNHALRTEIAKDGFVMDINQLHKGLCEGVRQDLYFCGFPTLKHLEHSIELVKAGVKVFQHPSRSESMLLHLQEKDNPSLDGVAREFVGKTVYVGYPHLVEALVVAVADQNMRYIMADSKEVKGESMLISEPLSKDALDIWQKDCSLLAEKYRSRLGILVGDTEYLVYARPISGRRYTCGQRGLVTLEKQWQLRPEPYLYQTIVKDISVYDETFTQFRTLDELFKKESVVFLLGNPHYGSMGHVLDVEIKDDPRVRINITVLPEPNLKSIANQQGGGVTRYFPGYSIAQKLSISPHLLSRITGTIFLLEGSREDKDPSRFNVGLNLKFNKTNQEVPGYSRKVEGDWLYSTKVQEILAAYISKFPQLFDKIRESKMNDNYYASEVFPNKPEMVKELKQYLKELPCKNVAPAKHGSCLLDEFTVQEIEKEVKRHKEMTKKKNSVKMQVRPHLLYQPCSIHSHSCPDEKTTFELFDRVVNVRDGYSVPLGLRGTIIGISTAEKDQDIVYEVVFDEKFIGGLTLRCSPEQAYRMPPSSLINLTYGERKDNPAAVQQSNARTFYNNKNVWNNSQQSFRQPEVGQQEVRQQEYRQQEVRQPTALATRQVQPLQQRQQLQQPYQKQQQQQRKQHTQQYPLQQQRQQHNKPQQQQQPQTAKQATNGNQNNQNFSQIWDQLRVGGGGVPVTHVTGPPPPCTDDLRPPPEWLQQATINNPPDMTTSSSADPDNTKASEHLKHLLGGIGKASQSAGIAVASSETSESENKTNTSSDKVAYGRQVTLEELFKGATNDQNSPNISSIVTDTTVPPPVLLTDNKNTLKASAGADSGSTAAELEQKQAMRQQQHAPLNQQQSLQKLKQNKPNVANENLQQQQQRPQQLQQQKQQQRSHQLQQQLQQMPQQQLQRSQWLQQRPPVNINQQTFVAPNFRQPGFISQPFISEQQRLAFLQSQQLQLQQQLQSQQRQSFQSNRQQMLNLQSFCEARGLGQPQYKHQQEADGRWRAQVSLRNGATFAGSYVGDREQAVESAAAVALFTLSTVMPMGAATAVMQRPAVHDNIQPRGFTASPNSAFTPVNAYPGPQNIVSGAPAGYQPKLRGFNPQSKITQSQQQHQQRQAQQAAQANNANQAVSDEGNEQTPQKNSGRRSQFIPTQVLRQQKTPQKKETETQSAVVATGTGDEPMNYSPTKSDAPSTTLSDVRTVESNNVSLSAKKREKKSRSRIAANFGSVQADTAS